MSNEAQQQAAAALTDRLTRICGHIATHPKVSYAALTGRAAREGVPKKVVIAALQNGVEAAMAQAQELIEAAYAAAAEGKKNSGTRTKPELPQLAAVEF